MASALTYAWEMQQEDPSGRPVDSSVESWFDRAVAAHESGRLKEAEGLYRDLLRESPEDAVVHELLGQVMISGGRGKEAVEVLRRATMLDAGSWSAWLALSVALTESELLGEAREACERALALEGGASAARVQRAVIAARGGERDRASAALGELVGEPLLEPASLRLLADAARRIDRTDLLMGVLERLPDLADEECRQLAGRARDAWMLGRVDDAERILAWLHARRGRDLNIVDNYARVLHTRGRSRAAMQVLEQAIVDRPEAKDLAVTLLTIASEIGDEPSIERGLTAIRRSHAEHVVPLLAGASTALRAIYRDEEERRSAREQVERDLREAEQRLDVADQGRAREVIEAVQRLSFFRLPALGGDVRAPAEVLGRITTRALQSLMPDALEVDPGPRRNGDGRIRVGVLSSFFRVHSNWRTHLSWLVRLDPARFEVVAFSTASSSPFHREESKRRGARWIDLAEDPLGIIRRLREERLDAIVIPEVGMDLKTQIVAAARIAPVQCTSWGHPITSGYPSCGWFLSSDLMEPPDGERHYSERLVRLPGLGVCLDLPTWSEPSRRRDRLGLAHDAVAFWCSQTIHKYLPQNDGIYASIAARCPRAVFVFIGPDNDVRRRLSDRLHRRMAEAGLDGSRHLRWLDPVGPDEFVRLGGECDVFIDCPAWSGCNTTLDAVAVGLPIATVPGSTMRARHTSAMLEQMGLGEFVARDEAAFVELASRMGTDAALRRHARELIIERRERLFGDRRPIEAVERLFEQAVRTSST